jgi:hypothetical protein
VRNGSSDYNYDEWTRTGRQTAAQQIKTDTRKQPKPEEPIELDPQIRLITGAGGILLFSGAQLHSTVPNTSGQTRYSIDFRTVHIEDVRAKKGAPNIDSACTGTTLRDYLRGTDSSIPEDVVLEYDTTQRTTSLPHNCRTTNCSCHLAYELFSSLLERPDRVMKTPVNLQTKGARYWCEWLPVTFVPSSLHGRGRGACYRSKSATRS